MRIIFWGSSPLEDQALIKSLRRRADQHDIDIDIEYVDVVANADRAREAQVRLTPSIDRLEPLPLLRLIALNGDAHTALEKLLP